MARFSTGRANRFENCAIRLLFQRSRLTESLTTHPLPPTPVMRNNHIASWLGQMLLGFGLFLGGFEVARISWGSWWEMAVAGAVGSMLGLALIVYAEGRQRPL